MTAVQNAQILRDLKIGLTITPLEALDKYGCFRLSARIFELKAQGWPIDCERRQLENGKIVGHYTMSLDKSLWP